MALDRSDLADLAALVALAEQRNFTRAAARLGVSQSALSHAMRRLEGRIGVRLLTRTTRSVSLTEAGMGLAMTVDDIVQEAVDSGRLVRVLEDWCPPFDGYHLYYTSRRQASHASALLVDALRHRPD